MVLHTDAQDRRRAIFAYAGLDHPSLPRSLVHLRRYRPVLPHMALLAPVRIPPYAPSHSRVHGPR